MHILHISNLFPRSWEAGAARPYLEAAIMARHGHAVTVITNQRQYLTDEIPPAAQGKLIHRTYEDGMEILSVITTAGRRASMLRRLLCYVSFNLMAFVTGLGLPRVDLVYVRTPPPLLPFIAYLLARLKGARLVIAIGDLHPEEAVEQGLIESPIVVRLWEALENFYRRRADLLVAIVPGMKPLLEAKGISPARIFISTNAYDPVEDRQEPLPAATVAALARLQGCFLVMFTGNIAIGSALEVALEAARQLQETHPKIQFVLVGHGGMLPRLQELARKWRLQNCHFLEPVPRNCMTTLLSHAQAVMYLTYAGKVHGVYDLPNKIFEYLGSGNPLVYSGRGTIAEIIKEARCGLVTSPEDSQAFAEAVIYLAEHPEEAQAMGLRGREYVMKNFDRGKIMASLVGRLEGLKSQQG